MSLAPALGGVCSLPASSLVAIESNPPLRGSPLVFKLYLCFELMASRTEILFASEPFGAKPAINR